MNKSNNVSLPALFGILTGLLVKNAKLYSLISILVCAAVGLATAAATPIKQWFFEAVGAASNNGSLPYAVWAGVFMGVFMTATLAVQGVSDVLMENLGIRLSGFLGRSVNEKAARIDPICFENNDMLNDINKAYQGVQKSGDVICMAVTNISFYIPYFLFLAVYLFNIHPILCSGMLMVFIPTFGGQFLRRRYYSKLENTAAPIRRRKEYYESCIVSREYAKETRLLGAVWFFRALYETAVSLFKKEQWKTQFISELVELGLRIISLAAYVLVLYLLYYYLKADVINTAVFAAVFTSIDQMFNYMDYVGYGMSDISRNLPAVQNTMRFLQLPERGGNDVTIDRYSVKLDNVSFAYPAAGKNTINHLSLVINEGETIAIVGENGAGKSTLVKLIAGLYLPTDGDIFIGEHNTKDISPQSSFNGISAVFQKYQRYKMSLKDNITISQAQDKANDDKLHDSLKKSDLEVDNRSFPDGLNTMLSREFDGTDLSGGQWQRVAIGRGFFRNHSMIILDEPTSAIDPLEETRIYKQFAEISKGKTSIVVTHRLGSAKIANRIIVMEHGQIVGAGTHDELMSRDGVYRTMYESQAKWYE